MNDAILLERADRIATITLNRPDRMNAFAGTMREDLLDAIRTVAADATSRVLVITGAGRAFCAGGDISYMAELKQRNAPFEEIGRLMEQGQHVVLALRDLDRPVIAAVNGPAMGAGLNLALACDLRIASDKASFGATFVRIGLHPDWGGSFFLPRIVGTSRALRMIWTGEAVSAVDALGIGLCDEVYPQEELMPKVRELAMKLAQAPAVAVAHAKQTVYLGMKADSVSADMTTRMEFSAQKACWDSPDSAEGINAFLEKRPPRFVGGT